MTADMPSLATAPTLLALGLYMIVTSVTPGPNNMMVLASGVNFGIRRTLPHIAGISLGFGAMVAIMGLGLGTVFERCPELGSDLAFTCVELRVKISVTKEDLVRRSMTSPSSCNSSSPLPLE